MYFVTIIAIVLGAVAGFLIYTKQESIKREKATRESAARVIAAAMYERMYPEKSKLFASVAAQAFEDSVRETSLAVLADSVLDYSERFQASGRQMRRDSMVASQEKINSLLSWRMGLWDDAKLGGHAQGARGVRLAGEAFEELHKAAQTLGYSVAADPKVYLAVI